MATATSLNARTTTPVIRRTVKSIGRTAGYESKKWITWADAGISITYFATDRLSRYLQLEYETVVKDNKAAAAALSRFLRQRRIACGLVDEVVAEYLNMGVGVLRTIEEGKGVPTAKQLVGWGVILKFYPALVVRDMIWKWKRQEV